MRLSLLKIYEVRNRPLGELRDYIIDRRKSVIVVDGQERDLVTSVNCSIPDVPREFEIIRHRYSAEERGYHIIIMFRKDETGPEMSFSVGSEFMEEICQRDFQAVLAAHVNKENMHCHMLVNGVSVRDGRTLREHYRYRELEELLNGICIGHGLSPRTFSYSGRASYIVSRKQKEGYPTKFNVIRSAFRTALDASTSFSEFERILSGYDVRIVRKDGKNRAEMYGEKESPMLETLGYEFTVPGIEKRLRRNRETRDLKRRRERASNGYRLPDREEHFLKRQGLKRDYALISLYLNGHPKRFDRYKFIDVRRDMKAELRKLHSYSRRIRFMSRYRPEDAASLKEVLSGLRAEERQIYEKREKLGCGYFLRKGEPLYDAFREATGRLRSIRRDIDTGEEILNSTKEVRDLIGKVSRNRESEKERSMNKKGPRFRGIPDI